MKKLTPKYSCGQVDPVRRDARNAKRYIAALLRVGIVIYWDGRHLRLTGRLPSRSRRHLVRLGPAIIRELQHLAAQEQPDLASVRPSMMVQ